MIQVQVDQQELEKIYVSIVKERLEEIESRVYYMNTKQLCAYMNMSWNTVVNNFLYEEGFPKIRVGSKWLFHRKEIEKYLDKHYEVIKASGGDILNMRKRVKVY